MKILIVSAGYPPYISGVATSTANLVNQISKKHEVLLISSTSNKNSSKTILHPLFTHYRLPGISLKQRIDLAIPFPHLKNIKNIIADFHPDIIHLQDPSPISLSSLYTANTLNIPTIITHHFTPEFIVKSIIPGKKISYHLSQSLTTKQLIYRLVKPIYNRCQMVTVPNNAFIKDFKKASLKTPITTIPNGICSKNFTHKSSLSGIRKKYKISQPKIILFVGRLDTDKSLDILIEAFGPLHQFNPNTSLVLVGDGTQKSKLMSQVKKLDLTHSVHFLGKISNQSKELSHLYNAAHIFVNPSLIENQSVSFIEAFTAGLPIIAIDHQNLNHFVKPNQNGILFEPNNPISLALAIQKLLKNPDLYQKISIQNKKTAKKFNISVTSKQYLSLYRSLIKASKIT